MPEGPEIRLAADEVAHALVGRPATHVFFAFEPLKKYEDMLNGRVVTAIDTYGKAMVTRFDNDLNIYSHNQLYGKWIVTPAGERPETNRQLRLAIANDVYEALLYSASDIEVLRDGEVDRHPFIRKVGPDPLNGDLTPADVATRLRDPRFHRRRLTSLLLDQGFLAGIGNYLRSEILFAAGVAPSLRPVDCTPAQIEALAAAAVELTRRSYDTRGITNEPDLVAALKAQKVSRVDYRFQVFNRDDRPCYRCGTPIVRDEAGSRRLYFCPACQAR